MRFVTAPVPEKRRETHNFLKLNDLTFGAYGIGDMRNVLGQVGMARRSDEMDVLVAHLMLGFEAIAGSGLLGFVRIYQIIQIQVFFHLS